MSAVADTSAPLLSPSGTRSDSAMDSAISDWMAKMPSSLRS